jgi:hypothetical protein
MSRLRLIALLLPFTVLGCGSGSGDDDDDVAAIDARPTPDSMPAPDAGPDAPPGAFDCIGDPFPTTAPGTITASGITESIDQNGTGALGSATVTANDASDAKLDTSTSDATSGAYALTITTPGTPVDGYLVGTHANYVSTYVYPPSPLASDQANVPVLMMSNTTYSFIPLLAGIDGQTASEGIVGVLVVDCFGNPVAGATVTSPVVTADNVRYVQGTGISSTPGGATDSSGIAILFNVPAGTTPVTLDASTADHAFLEHAIIVRAGSLTTTVVAPGPIAGLAP